MSGSNRNKKCPCGSGKKFKKCCYLKTLPGTDFWNKLSAGEIPLRAEISSTSSSALQPTEMVVGPASVEVDGQRTVLFDRQIRLSIDNVREKSDSGGSVIFEAPMTGATPTLVQSNSGNFQSGRDEFQFDFPAGKKKIVLKTKNNMVRLLLQEQRDEGLKQYLHIYYNLRRGEDHSHFSFSPSLSHEYVGRRGHCSVETSFTVDPITKTDVPKKILITEESTGCAFSLELEVVKGEKKLAIREENITLRD